MGNCYNFNKDDNDILSDVDPLEKFKSNNKKLDENNIIFFENNNNNDNNIDIINDNNDNDINIIDTNINNIIQEQNKDIYNISKTKLKLTIKQSKNLPEGKEYLINSLGLLINNENKTKDGLAIFGDKNVIFNFII